MPLAIENQKEHDSKRRRLEKEGRTPESPPTFRQEFCAHGANPTVTQRMEKTAFSTRRDEITVRGAQALEKMESENTNELSRQLRENFMIHSTRTSKLVENLFNQFKEELKGKNNNTPLDPAVSQNHAFVRAFKNIRGVEDYVRQVQIHGILYALTPKQCEELGRKLKIDRAKWRHAAIAAGKIMEDLEDLWLKSLK